MFFPYFACTWAPACASRCGSRLFTVGDLGVAGGDHAAITPSPAAPQGSGSWGGWLLTGFCCRTVPCRRECLCFGDLVASLSPGCPWQRVGARAAPLQEMLVTELAANGGVVFEA